MFIKGGHEPLEKGSHEFLGSRKPRVQRLAAQKRRAEALHFQSSPVISHKRDQGLINTLLHVLKEAGSPAKKERRGFFN